MAKAIIDPHLLRHRSARELASRLSWSQRSLRFRHASLNIA